MSAPLSVTVSAGSAPPAPATITGVTHCKPSPRTYTIQWSGVTGATRYEVEEKVDASTTYQTLTTVTGTSSGFNRTSTVEGQYYDMVMYSYRVRACNVSGCSPWKGTAYACVGNALRPALVLSSQVTYLHTDALGSPVAETNASGTVTRRMHYEPYGAPTTGSYTDGPAFTGHVQDAVTGLTYMQQRYYDPLAGRFLSVDPVGADPNTGGNFNRYWYADNNPYRYTDPDGRCANLCTGLIGAGIGLAFNGAVEGYRQYQQGEFNPRSLGVELVKGAVVGGLIGLTGSAAAAPQFGLSTGAQAAATGSVGLGVGAGAHSVGEVAKGNAAPSANESLAVGAATAIGGASGPVLAAGAKSATTSVIPAVRSHPVVSTRGNTFHTVNIPAQAIERPRAAAAVGAAAAIPAEQTAQKMQ